jgi:hypothetical protein
MVRDIGIDKRINIEESQGWKKSSGEEEESRQRSPAPSGE